jgi:hypothetical protein
MSVQDVPKRGLRSRPILHGDLMRLDAQRQAVFAALRQVPVRVAESTWGMVGCEPVSTDKGENDAREQC